MRLDQFHIGESRVAGQNPGGKDRAWAVSEGNSAALENRVRAMALMLALATLLVYLPASFHGFFGVDDGAYVEENEIVQRGVTWAGLKWAFTTFASSNWHPLTWISHMLDCQLFGLNPGAHHCINILIHAANSLLLFLLWFRLTRDLWPSAFVAALFAWHPLHVESVAWIAERKDLLSAFFGLLSLRCYARYAQKKSKAGDRASSAASTLDSRPPAFDYFLALLFFALGLLCKPMLVTLPFVFLLLDFWPLQRIARADTGPSGSVPRLQARLQLWAWVRLAAEKWPFMSLAAASSVVTYLAQRDIAVVPLEAYPYAARAGNAVWSYARYLKNAVWPTDLAVLYPLPMQLPLGQVALSAAILIALSALAWRARRQSPYFLAGWLWYLGMLVPVLGLVQVGQQAMADRYTYLPLIGIFVAVAWGVKSFAPRLHLPARALALLSAILLCACVLVTLHQLNYWQTTEHLLRRTLAVTQNNPFAHTVLSTELVRQHRWDEATREASQAIRLEKTAFIEGAVEKDYRIRTHILLAQLFEMRNRGNDALGHYQDALRLDPESVEAHNNLGNLLNKMGRKNEALAHYQAALRYKPDAIQARANLGTLLIELGQLDEGMSQYTEAARLKPEDPVPHYLLGKAWLRRGQSARAVVELNQVMRLDPNNFHAGTYLARLLAGDPDSQVRDGKQAIALAERANALSSHTQPLVLDTLAMAYAETGRFDDACRTVAKAIELSQIAGARSWADAMRLRLQLYQSGQPYREASTNILFAPSPPNSDSPTQSGMPSSARGSSP